MYRSCSAANRSFLCAAVWLQLCFPCLVAIHIVPKSLSSSGHFLCPVAVRTRLKSLSSSGLSSAKLALSAIPSKRAALQSGVPNCSQCSKGQCTRGQCDRKPAGSCIRCGQSCAMHAQTDIHIHINIYKYHGISNRLRLLALLCSPLGN